jgi:AcrR family transcriptional regulator
MRQAKALRTATKTARGGGRREQKKADKLRRIKEAARELFSRWGYEATTTRAIAARAGVSVGTVFVYAPDKGELVCLMAVERLQQEFARAFDGADLRQPLLEQLVSICAHMFRDSARHLPLSRILIKEMVAYRHKHEIDDWIEARLEKLVAAALRRGELSLTEKPAFVARALNLTYLAVMRDWIMNERPRPAAAIRDVRRLFAIQLHGLNYRPAAMPQRGGRLRQCAAADGA